MLVQGDDQLGESAKVESLIVKKLVKLLQTVQVAALEASLEEVPQLVVIVRAVKMKAALRVDSL